MCAAKPVERHRKPKGIAAGFTNAIEDVIDSIEEP
jgi:hypothetical protein